MYFFGSMGKKTEIGSYFTERVSKIKNTITWCPKVIIPSLWVISYIEDGLGACGRKAIQELETEGVSGKRECLNLFIL